MGNSPKQLNQRKDRDLMEAAPWISISADLLFPSYSGVSKDHLYLGKAGGQDDGLVTLPSCLGSFGNI